jgi:lipoprotein-anchoring transpeptidase ErfK/SrfK
MQADGLAGTIKILNYEQAQAFDLVVTGALGENGKTMTPGDYVTRITTPVALKVDISPAPGQSRVPNQSDITFTFSEEVANTAALAETFVIDPPTPGAFTWVSANQAKFTPQAKWQYETIVKVKVKGGPRGVAGLNGNYIDRDIATEFTTMPQKMIDLNLSEQKLYCYEDGALVFECWVATGKAGYRTRTGDFRIYAKDRYVDMRSSEGDAEPYEVLDVPFVNWFSGGMAIHGCYWSSEYGYARSHGCVNVSVGNAETIYEWAPVGTPVFSHY